MHVNPATVHGMTPDQSLMHSLAMRMCGGVRSACAGRCL